MNKFISRLVAAGLALTVVCGGSGVLAVNGTSRQTAATVSAKSGSSISIVSGGKTVKVTSGGAPVTLNVTSPEELPKLSGGVDSCTVTIGGKTVHEGKTLDFKPLKNGTYTYNITSGGTRYSFRAKVDLPPEVVFASSSVPVGDAMVIHVYYSDETATASPVFGFTAKFFSDGGRQTALLPINYGAKSGQYPLTIKVGGKAFNYQLTVADYAFEVQHLTIDQGTAAATNTADANLEWERTIEPLKPISDDTRYWTGTFMQPVQGPISTQYGMTRYTNGSTVPSRHSGIDIAAGRYSPVHATNNGRVQFAGFLQLTGNTVVIEHGMGLKSLYYHMDSTSTTTGAMVNKGDEIGKVGSTGYSTGPHLHFCMAVNNVFINPWTAIQKGYN